MGQRMSIGGSPSAAVDDAVRIIRARPDLARFVGGCAVEEVLQAETIFGRRFPESYRLFLLTLGCGSFGGEEVYGIVPGKVLAEGVPCVVWMNMKARNARMPDDWLEIAVDGFGGSFVVRLGACPSDDPSRPFEPPIDLWPCHLSPSEAYEVAPSFGHFLLNQVVEVVGRSASQEPPPPRA